MSLTSSNGEPRTGPRTGIDSLDYEHSKIVGVMEDLCDRFDSGDIPGEVSDSFGTLHAEVTAHFALEEYLMRERKYALADEHKADHERLLDQIRFMMDAYEDGKCVDCGTTLRACLSKWFAGHEKDAEAWRRALAE
jgi:hemerythrin